MALIPDSKLKLRRDIGFARRGKCITYKKFISESVDFTTTPPSKGTTYAEAIISKALVGEIEQTVLLQSKGKYTPSDTAFRVRVGDMIETVPSQKSKVIYNNVSYKILGYGRSPDTLTYDIYCREVT